MLITEVLELATYVQLLMHFNFKDKPTNDTD